MAVPAVALVAIFATVAPLIAAVASLIAAVALLVSGRRTASLLTARLAFARAALVALEVAIAAAASSAPAIGTVGVGVALARGRRLGFGFRCLGGGAAKELFHPAENATGFFRFLRRRGGHRFALRPAGVGNRRRRGGVGARLARFERTIIAALALGAEVRAVAAPIFAPWALFGRTGLRRSARLAARLAGGGGERFALPIVLNSPRRFGRKDLQLGLRFGNGGFDRR